MAGSVKPRRSYDSPRRREQAAATRQAILDAAQLLYERDGYSATSMPAIAAAANVASKTVYLAFGTKSGVLHALWNVRLGGDDEPVPVVERPWYIELLAVTDPEEQLRAFAAQSRTVKTRAGTVMKVVRDAAAVDDDIAELWATIESEFREVIAPLAERWQRRRVLASGIDASGATDIMWTLNHPDVWQLLTGGCGWRPEHYERWLADTLCSQLLRPKR